MKDGEQVLGNGLSLEAWEQIRCSVTETKATGILDSGANNLEQRMFHKIIGWK